MEVISLSLIFFLQLSSNHKDFNQIVKLVEYITTNFYIFLTLIKKVFYSDQVLTKYQKIDQFMNTSNCLKLFTIKGSFVKLLSKNNTLIELSLNKIVRKINKPIKIKLEKLIKEVSNQNFQLSLARIF